MRKRTTEVDHQPLAPIEAAEPEEQPEETLEYDMDFEFTRFMTAANLTEPQVGSLLDLLRRHQSSENKVHIHIDITGNSWFIF